MLSSLLAKRKTACRSSGHGANFRRGHGTDTRRVRLAGRSRLLPTVQKRSVCMEKSTAKLGLPRSLLSLPMSVSCMVMKERWCDDQMRCRLIGDEPRTNLSTIPVTYMESQAFYLPAASLSCSGTRFVGNLTLVLLLTYVGLQMRLHQEDVGSRPALVPVSQSGHAPWSLLT